MNRFFTVFGKMVAVAALVGLVGCAPVVGTASFTMISKTITAENSNFKPVSERVMNEDCFTAGPLMLVWWGTSGPNHEAVVQRTLTKYNADVLLDTELRTTQFFIPYIFMQACAVVEGVPAILKGE